MPPRRGAEVHLNVAVPMELADKLDVFCKKRKVKKKKIVELAVRRIVTEADGSDGDAGGNRGDDPATGASE